MVKGTAKHEIILMFDAHYSAQEIIKMGYSKPTVYKYHFYYKEAVKKFKEKIGSK